jgi:YHS domain-containing protein
MESTQQLATSIDAAFASMHAKRRQFQEVETRKYEEWRQRLAKLGTEFDALRDIFQPRLDLLIEKFGDQMTATPRLTQSTREILLELHPEMARIRLRFQGTTDHDIRRLILNYDLEIIPILLQFDSHSTMEMPLDAVEREAALRWADERIMSFVRTYTALHENPYYLRDQMVTDPVSGTTFPKLAAGATLERDGRTYYFVSETTRREFESRGAARDDHAAAGRTGMTQGRSKGA